MKNIYVIFILIFLSVSAFSQKNELIYLWQGKVQGEPKEKQTPSIDASRKDNVLRYSEVTNQAMEVFLPDAAKRNRSAVIVCP